MRVTVLGGGNGAMAVAGEWALAGHEVRIAELADYRGPMDGVAQAGAITLAGKLEGQAPIASCGVDFGEALEGAELVFVVGPAFATEPLARGAAPFLTDGMTVVVCPGSCLGAVAFARAAGIPLDAEGITIAETSTLPYAARITDTATVQIFHRLTGGLYVAALGGQERTQQTSALLRQVWEGMEPARNVWQTALQNGNPVIHPAVTLLNACLIERTGGDFLFYEEGVTPASGALMAAVDAERLAIGRALGATVLSEPAIGVAQEYMQQENYTTGYSTAPGFLGIKAQSSLDNRYLTEDVGFSMIFFTDIARAVGVPTPIMDAIIAITEVVLDTDYRAAPARTLESLGLGGMSTEQLQAI